MKTLLTFAGLFSAAVSMCGLGPATTQAVEPKIRLMLLTGQGGQYHNWALSSAMLFGN